tara:strand:+ start:59849 stop:60244 length:396 start_codon:yes stop_codon:yes gene_type:complete
MTAMNIDTSLTPVTSTPIYQIQVYTDLFRCINRQAPFVLVLKHHDAQDLACILDTSLVQCAIHYANVEELPALALIFDAYCLPEVLAFDSHGRLQTRAHLNTSQFGATQINAEWVNKAYAIAVNGRSHLHS